jgi:hypothetical protein
MNNMPDVDNEPALALGEHLLDAASQRIEIPVLATLEEWEFFTNETHALTQIQEVTLCATLFMLGDLWNQGVERYGEDQCLQIAASQNWSERRMMNVARVARQVKPQLRKHDLTFKHHEEVSALPVEKQEAMLAKAEDEELSAGELRRKIRGRGALDSANSSETDVHGTPSKYVEASRTVLGGIDLDPASNEAFNGRVVKAAHFYAQAINGLQQPWHGTVFCNPPYGQLEDGTSVAGMWAAKMISEYKAGVMKAGILLVNANVGDRWFEPLKHYLISLPDHRIRFEDIEGKPGTQPRHSSAFIYIGPNEDDFIRVFSEDVGPVFRRMVPVSL